jgi:hypothetical protein
VNYDLTGIVIYDSATAESITLSGSLHSIETTTTDSAGGLHVTIHANFQDVTAVGLTTGWNYQLQEEQQVSFNLTAGVAQEGTAEATVHIIGQGSIADYKLHAQTKFNFDVNGVLTAFQVSSQS